MHGGGRCMATGSCVLALEGSARALVASMGTTQSAVASPLSPVPRISYRGHENWVKIKERTEKNFSRKFMRDEDRCLLLLTKLYEALGGTTSQESPICIKGGAAAWLYFVQQRSFLRGGIADVIGGTSVPADFDFASSMEVSPTIAAGIRAVRSMSETAGDLDVNHEGPWHVRNDATLGEAYAAKERKSLGKIANAQSPPDLPMKMTYHAGLTDRGTGTEFDLVRLGLALWHTRLQRATTAALVDISIGKRSEVRFMTVMNMQIQTARSMLRESRRMLFHEVHYEPWVNGSLEKQCRRFHRLVLLSFIEDFKLMGGATRGDEACDGLLLRWRKLPELLIIADGNDLRRRAESSPLHLRCFLRIAARICKKAWESGRIEEYDEWLEDVIFPCIRAL